MVGSQSTIFLIGLLGCTIATVSSLDVCTCRKDCDHNCHLDKEAEVLQVCRAPLSFHDVDNRISLSQSFERGHTPHTHLRSRSVAEMQPYLIAYGLVIGAVSPLASCYQLVRLNPHVTVPTSEMVRLSLSILPHQAVLKDLQMTIATPIKKHCNPWAAFALIGVLQGGLYGHANVHFANALGIGTRPSLKSVFRGVGFAGTRDLISQGFPFVLAPVLEKKVMDALLPSKSALMSGVKHWLSVFSMSVIGTYMSQGLHNSQITMQAHPELGYVGAVKQVFSVNGLAALWKGAEARVGLLLVVAFLNDVLLKKAWQGVEDKALPLDWHAMTCPRPRTNSETPAQSTPRPPGPHTSPTTAGATVPPAA